MEGPGHTPCSSRLDGALFQRRHPGAAAMPTTSWGNSPPSYYVAKTTGSVRAVTKAPRAVRASSPAAEQRVPDSLTQAEWGASWDPMLWTMPLGMRAPCDRNA